MKICMATDNPFLGGQKGGKDERGSGEPPKTYFVWNFHVLCVLILKIQKKKKKLFQ